MTYLHVAISDFFFEAHVCQYLSGNSKDIASKQVFCYSSTATLIMLVSFESLHIGIPSHHNVKVCSCRQLAE